MIQGLSMGNPVRSGRLQTWPIYGPDHDVGFVGSIRLADDDDGYGSLGLQTDHPRGGIAPHGMAFFFANGQDRAIRESVFVPAGQTLRVSALCVEPAQGGFWEGQETKIKALPASLLAALPEHATGYQDLWSDIEARYAAMGKSGETVAGLLKGDKYLMPHDMIDGQARGVMIAIDGRVVALQVAPNRDAFRAWWNEYGLSESYAFEAQTLPRLPAPLGVLDGNLEAEREGMYRVTFLDVLKGWIYVKMGAIQFASLLEKEGLTIFKQHGEQVNRASGAGYARQTRVSGEWEIPDNDR